jgi:hypothetical protein
MKRVALKSHCVRITCRYGVQDIIHSYRKCVATVRRCVSPIKALQRAEIIAYVMYG